MALTVSDTFPENGGEQASPVNTAAFSSLEMNETGGKIILSPEPFTTGEEGAPADATAPAAETAPVSQAEESRGETERRFANNREKRAHNRYQKMANENSWLRSQLEVFQQELSEKEQALAQWREESRHHRSKYEEGLKERLVDSEAGVRDQLKQARLDGDIDREVELTDRLAELKTDRAKLDMLDILPDERAEESTFVPARKAMMPPPPPVEPELPEELIQFYERNSWADPQSPDFRSDLAEKVSALSDTLDEQLEKQGQKDLFGTDRYFRILEGAAQRLFFESSGNSGKLPTKDPAPSRGLDVARSGGSQADAWLASTGSGQHVTLTAPERQMALSIGAQMGWSDKDAVARFAQNKQKTETLWKRSQPGAEGFNRVPMFHQEEGMMS